MSFLLFRQFESMYSFGYDCEWNFGLAYYPNVCSVYEIMGECPLLGSPFLV